MLDNVKDQATNELTVGELANPNGVPDLNDYNCYSRSLGSAIVRRNAISALKNK